MYRILLDSSNRLLAVGLGKDHELIDQTIYEAWQRQSESMIPEIHHLLEKHHVNKEDIEAVVVSIGPGSYTGVRIALTIAKVMSLALSIPIYAISSLKILKENEVPSICVMNARSSRSYVGVYKGNQTLVKDTIWTNEEVLNYIKEHPSYLVCGDVTHLELETRPYDHLLKTMLDLSYEEKPVENALGLTPVYLKD